MLPLALLTFLGLAISITWGVWSGYRQRFPWAAARGDLEEVLRTLGREPERAREAKTLAGAVWGSHNAVIMALLGHGADVRRPIHGTMTALHIAAHVGNREMIPVLLRHGAELDAGSPRTALWWAAKAGHVDMVSLLLRHGADPHAVALADIGDFGFKGSFGDPEDISAAKDRIARAQRGEITEPGTVADRPRDAR